MEKLKKWYELHWKTVLGIFIVIIPIGVYKLAVHFAVKDVISANNIFTGLMTFCGIVFSFFGIYWKVNLDEKTKNKQKNEELNERLTGLMEVYIENIFSNERKFFKITQEQSKNYFEKNLLHYFSLAFDDNKISDNWFFTVEEKIFSDNNSVILQSKELRTLYRFNNEMILFNRFINILKNKNTLYGLHIEIQNYMKKDIENKIFFKFLENELYIMQLLFVNNKLATKQIYKLVQENIEILKKICKNDLWEKYQRIYLATNLICKEFNRESIKEKLKEQMLFITNLLLNEVREIQNIDLQKIREKIILYCCDVFEFLELVEKMVNEFEKVKTIIQQYKQQDS